MDPEDLKRIEDAEARELNRLGQLERKALLKRRLPTVELLLHEWESGRTAQDDMLVETMGKSSLGGCLNVVSAGLMFALLALLSKGTDLSNLEIAILAPLMVFPVGYFARSIIRSKNQNIGDLRSIWAQAILEAVRRNIETPPFFLYLRTFDLDDKLPQQITSSIGLFDPRFYQEQTADFSYALSNALVELGQTVGLVRDGIKPGIGEIISEDSSWKRDISILMERARLIFMIPASNEGTAWELDQVARHYLLKTLFVIPPNTHGFATSNEWLCEQGIPLVLPSVSLKNGRGAFVAIKPSASVPEIDRSGIRDLRKSYRDKSTMIFELCTKQDRSSDLEMVCYWEELPPVRNKKRFRDMVKRFEDGFSVREKRA